jgi:Zn-dependent M28 family amino/carboxypeptidase
MGALQLIKSLGLTPRRTLRVVAFMNEENGVRGGKAYFAANQKALATHVAAIEADSGAGRPLGVLAYLPLEQVGLLKPVQRALQPLGATVVEHVDEPLGADISPLQYGGVPGFEPLLDGRSYFSYHHTAADTLDKVDPDNLRRQVAVLAVLCWSLSEATELPRSPVRAQPGPPPAAPKR